MVYFGTQRYNKIKKIILNACHFKCRVLWYIDCKEL